MNYYLKTGAEVLEAVDSSEKGLTTEEAALRLEKNGRNRLAEGKKTTLLQRFIAQLINPMVLVLLAAAAVSAVTAIIAEESFADVFIILFVVILNTILGVVQESKAEKAIEALKEMSSATSKVLRDGVSSVVRSEDLVCGDVVLLEAGDAIPADGRLIESASLKIEEAALTGESVPVEKVTAPLAASDNGKVTLGDRKNMAYMGSCAVYGRGRMVITGTGMDTEMGKIADAITRAEDGETPLQKKLSSLSRFLTWLVLGICVVMFGVSLLRAGSISGEIVLDTFMLAVSLAVAAIPEGLAAVVTIVLSIGTTRMSKRNAIIRRLTAVETLGCTQIICSDKTGTLTQNKMTVVDYFGDDEKSVVLAFALCNDATPGADGQAVGDPTECATVNRAGALGIDMNEMLRRFPRVGEIPFDSMRKMHTTVHSRPAPDRDFVQYTVGAPDIVIARCTACIRDGRVIPLDDEGRDGLIAENHRMASKALRVLACSTKNLRSVPETLTSDTAENDLIFLGLVGMIDPVRPEVPEAIEACRSAGIRPVMITGDHLDTASAIAMQLGIISDRSQAITGAQLDLISDEDFMRRVTEFSVYARVQPEHKVRIVNAWRANGYITAMTGDGVNDAPSIKNADIGIGMGITGTDVTKNVADMILADDNFATIVKAVGEGRRIYDNIRKSIQFLLSSNLSEVISIFCATMLGFTILNPIHILFINLITDSLPALALGLEKEEPDLMKRAPRNSSDGIFAGGVGFNVFYQGLLVSVLTLAAYFIGHFLEAGEWAITESPDGMTMAFLTMAMAEIFHSYNMRAQRNSIFRLGTHNIYLFGAMVLSLLLTTGVIYVPFLRELFGFEYISLIEYGVAMALAVSVIPIVELVKLIQRACSKNYSRT